MHKHLLIVAAALALTACTGQDQLESAKRTLAHTGLKAIDVRYPNFSDTFKCGKEDHYTIPFHALDANDQSVTGVVCSGMFKGSTVRFDFSLKAIEAHNTMIESRKKHGDRYFGTLYVKFGDFWYYENSDQFAAAKRAAATPALGIAA